MNSKHLNQKLLSHRGRCRDCKEGSIGAIKTALKSQIPYLEIDVRFTKDKKIVIFHDRFIKGKKSKFNIFSKTLEEIRVEERIDEETLPTLERVVSICRLHNQNTTSKTILCIDLKDNAELSEKCIELVKDIPQQINFYTWTPKVVFDLYQNMLKNKISIPIFFSHVRTDSFYNNLPFILKIPFLEKFAKKKYDAVFLDENNYSNEMGENSYGCAHIALFREIPSDLIFILKETNGGVCVTTKISELKNKSEISKFDQNKQNFLESLRSEGLKIAVFGGVVNKIDSKEKIEVLARKKYVDIIFCDLIEAYTSFKQDLLYIRLCP